MEYVFNRITGATAGQSVVELSCPDDYVPRIFLLKARVDGLQLFKDNLDVCIDEYEGTEQSIRLLTSNSGNLGAEITFTVLRPETIKLKVRTASLDTFTGSIQVL